MLQLTEADACYGGWEPEQVKGFEQMCERAGVEGVVIKGGIDEPSERGYDY